MTCGWALGFSAPKTSFPVSPSSHRAAQLDICGRNFTKRTSASYSSITIFPQARSNNSSTYTKNLSILSLRCKKFVVDYGRSLPEKDVRKGNKDRGSWGCLRRDARRGPRASAHNPEELGFRHFGVPYNTRVTNNEDSPSEAVDEEKCVIKVSKELMGLFRYIEKLKRAKIQELADTLRQCAAACLFFTWVRGILGPLVEVFQTTPPSWGKLLLMLMSFDSFAICYLAMKASEPMVQLATLATESQQDIMGGIEREEEMMLNLATELVKLFRRLRNIAISVAFSQFAQIVFNAMQLQDPQFCCKLLQSCWKLATCALELRL